MTPWLYTWWFKNTDIEEQILLYHQFNIIYFWYFHLEGRRRRRRAWWEIIKSHRRCVFL